MDTITIPTDPTTRGGVLPRKRPKALTSDFFVLGKRVAQVPGRLRTRESMALRLDTLLAIEVPRGTKNDTCVGFDRWHHGAAIATERALAVSR